MYLAKAYQKIEPVLSAFDFGLIATKKHLVEVQIFSSV